MLRATIRSATVIRRPPLASSATTAGVSPSNGSAALIKWMGGKDRTDVSLVDVVKVL